MFEVIRQAGLRTREVGRLLGTSRVTVSLWLNGHTSPHRLHANKVNKFLDALKHAVEVGELPPPKGLKPEERETYVTNVVIHSLRELRETAEA
jgi:transcriptional regulator with XRE-family HTH domain